MKIIPSRPRPEEKPDPGELVLFEAGDDRPVNGRLGGDGYVYIWLRTEGAEALYRRIPDEETRFGLELTLSAPLFYDLRVKGSDEEKLANVMGRVRKQWLEALSNELTRTGEGKVETGLMTGAGHRVVITNTPDGEDWWFEITIDRDCFELHTPPMTLSRATRLKDVIQQHVFDFAAKQRFTIRLDLPPMVDPWCRSLLSGPSEYTATYEDHGYQYSFCSQECLSAFNKDPAAAFLAHRVGGAEEGDACGYLHPADPVCGTCVIDLDGCGFVETHLNQKFFFCSEACRTAFKRDPAGQLTKVITLVPHRVEGAGHIHIDLTSGFHLNHRHLVNFVTEINNLGLWPFTDFRVLEHEARPLSIQAKAQQNYLAFVNGIRNPPKNLNIYLQKNRAALCPAQREVVTAILNIESMVYGQPIKIEDGEMDGAIDDDNAKYQTVCLRRYRTVEPEFQKATVEIRAFRPQANAAEIIQILELMNRLLLHTETDRIIEYRPIAFTRPAKPGSDQLEDHFSFSGPPLATCSGRILDLFERLGLDILDYRALFPAVLQAEVLDQYQTRQSLAREK